MKICFFLILLVATNALAASRATFLDLPGTPSSTNNPPAVDNVNTNPPTDLDTTIQAAANYQSGQSLEPLRRLEEGVRQSTARPEVRKELEAGLIRLLGTNATFEARKFAAKQLGIIGSQSALPALEQLLQDEDTVGLACLALTTYPSGKADALLRGSLKFGTPKSRVQVINTLGDRKDIGATDLLAHQASDPDAAVAEAAIAALGKIGTSTALKNIRSVAARSRTELKAALEEALLRYAENSRADGNLKAALPLYSELLQDSDQVAVRRTVLAALLQTDKDGGEKRIFEILSGSDEALKPVAIQKIASVPGARASERFATQLHHLSLENQALLIQSLAARGDDSARLELAKSLSSPNSVVRRAGIAALGRMGDPYFVSLLARAAGSGDGEEAKAIETALVELRGGTETDKRLLAELKNALPKARVPLINAVARRQGSAANSILLEEVESSDPAVAKTALRALARTGSATEAGSLLTKISAIHDPGVRTEAQSTATQLLAKVSDPMKRFGAVKTALDRTNSVDERVVLLELLPACSNSAALEVLKTAAHDPEIKIREASLRALAEWPDEAAWEPLLAIYRQPDTEGATTIALGGLVRLLNEKNAAPDSTLIGQYRELFATARSERDLKLLLGSISTVPDPDALNLVMPLLSHPGTYREAAAAAQTIVATIKAKRPELLEEAQKRLQHKTGLTESNPNLN